MTYLIAAAAVIGLVGAAVWILCFNDSSSTESADKPHVLVVFSEDRTQYNTFADIENTMTKAFKEKGIDANLTFDYLSCDRWEAEREVEEAGKIITRNNREKNIDMLVTIGDQATYSTLCNDIPLLHKVPIVFGGVQFPNWKQLAAYPNATGVVDSVDICKNIYAAYTLTGRKQTFMMLNKSFLDMKMRDEIDRQLRTKTDIRNNTHWNCSIMELLTDYQDSFSLSVMSLRYLNLNTRDDKPMDPNNGNNLRIVLRKFKDLVYIQGKYDHTPLQTIRTTNYLPMLTATWKGFGGEDNYYIGGYFASGKDIANDVAEYARKIFAGEKPKNIKVGMTRKDYYLNWQVAKAYGFKHNTLPEGYNVVNMPWKDKYPLIYTLTVYSGGIIVTLLLIVLVRQLVKERRQKNAVMQQLERENSLYNMAVQDSPTFAWEHIGPRINISEKFWHYYGKQPRQITIGDFMSMLHPDSQDKYREGLSHVKRGESYYNEVQADFYGNGEWQWFQIKGKGILDDNGRFVKSYGMITNIDSFKQKEKEMMEARKQAEEATLKQSFLANMSHEIRTPLNAIVGFSELILQHDADFTEEDKKLFADTIHTNNELLLKLINDILDVSRLESGHMDFKIKPCSVKEIMDKVYQTFAVQMPDHLQFIYNQDSNVIIKADEGRLRQVITNFLTNASKFTPEGSITLGWKVDEQTGKVEMYVEDTGIGLSEEDRKMVFSRFFKKDEFKQGTGLGLSICKLIVSRLGGEIKVKSQLGKGSRFSVYLKFNGR